MKRCRGKEQFALTSILGPLALASTIIAMYVRSGAIFSRGERAAFEILEQFARKRRCIVLKEVALSRVIAAERSELTDREFQHYSRASLDFVVASDGADNPWEFAIEFDGRYHSRPKQLLRDEIKNRLCAQAGLPLLRVSAKHIKSYEQASLLQFILDLYVGERAMENAIADGLVGPEEEFFPSQEFVGTSVIRRRLHRMGILPAIGPAIAGEGAERLLWYRVLSGHRKEAEGSSTRIEVMQGWRSPQIILGVERSVVLSNCSPASNVPGVHGWFIESEFSIYLAFRDLERQIARHIQRRK